MKNVLLPAELLRYENGYAVVKFKQYDGDDPDLEQEETMMIRVNSESQNLPNVGADVLTAFDNFSELYMLGEIVSENQPSADIDNPTKRILANDKASVTLDESGNVEIKNENGTVIVEAGGDIILNGGTEPAVKGELFKGTYDGHKHSTAFGPSGDPLVPIPPTNLNQTVKV